MPDTVHVERAIEGTSRWVTAQRWYGDKSRTLSSLVVEHLSVLDADAGKAAFAIVRCAFDTGDDARYFVPVSWHDGADQLSIRDALSDPEFLAWFFSGFRERRSLVDDGDWTWSRYDAASRTLDAVDEDRSRLMDVEQSNSSALFDNRIMLKVFRRLQPGINPDLEVTRYLTSKTSFTHVPALFGMLEGTFGEETFALGVLQEFVPNHGDCWGWFGKTLRALTPGSMDDAVEAVGLLGQRTAEMHVALAKPTTDPAFAPLAITPEYGDALLDRVRSELDETAAMLGRTPGDNPEVDHLVQGLSQSLASADSLLGTHRIRIHGDYHLGQVLRTLEDDYAIIDFEGEPSRSFEQRREKASPLRDVAGMLRSLGYASGTLRKETTDERLLSLVDEWDRRSRQAYLNRYRSVIERSGLPLAPNDDATFDSALHILEIEKSLYEARYEMNNRPDWLDIPMSALRLLATGERP